jgi:hypothetical protein
MSWVKRPRLLLQRERVLAVQEGKKKGNVAGISWIAFQP